MMSTWKAVPSIVVALVAALMAAGCSESNRTTSPVELIATVDQDVLVFDLLNFPPFPLATITMRAITKGPVTDTRFLDVQLKSYRVSYVRTDGGRQVPPPFVKTTSGLLLVGGSAQSVNGFDIFDLETLNRAPFQAILPRNGGVDPETGQPIVKFDVILEIFGETLAGDAVSTSVRIPLWFCAGCTIVAP